MNIAQSGKKAVMLIALILLPVCTSAQSFQLVSQEGYATASAFASSPEGSPSESEQNSIPDTNPIDVFAGATASSSEASASAFARLGSTLGENFLTIDGTMDGNGSVSNTLEQSAGSTAATLLRTVFRVDAPALLTLTGETHRTWSGSSSVETNIVLSSATANLADLSGIDGSLDYQGILLPGETYTFTAYGIANGTTSDIDTFISTQGSFTLNLRLEATTVPAPSSLAVLGIPGLLGMGAIFRRRRK